MKNQYKGRNAVLFCSGPSLKRWRAPEEGLLKVGVNSTVFADLDLDHLFIQDPGHESNKSSYMAKRAEYESFVPTKRLHIGTSLSPVLKEAAERIGSSSYEFTSAPIIDIGNARIEDPRIPARFSNDLDIIPCAAAGSIAFPALQHMLFWGCEKIYIVGADITNNERFNDSENPNDYLKQNHIGRWQEFASWVKLAYPDVEIIVANPIGLYKVFSNHIKTMPRMRFHFLCPPNTGVGMGMQHCAFTAKVERFSASFAAEGHDVFVYSHKDSIVDKNCVLVPVIGDSDLALAYGSDYVKGEWKTKISTCTIGDYAHQVYTQATIKAMKNTYEPNDFICCWYGHAHQTICEAFPDAMVCEPSVGCFKTFAPFRAYETQHLRSFVEGMNKSNVRWFDTVIPPGFDPDDFDVEDPEDYFLFLGRLDKFKGARIAIEVARRAGVKLIVAGQGCIEDVWDTKLPDNVSFVGYADKELRRRLYAKAKGFFVPSTFQEPCCWTAIEAMMSGVPVICSDHAGMTATVLQGITGFRCQTMYDFVAAVMKIDEIDRAVCREWAVKNFTVDLTTQRMMSWFNKLLGLKEGTANDWYGYDLTMASFDAGYREYPG